MFKAFQLTTSRRGRQVIPAHVIHFVIFQLTTSRKGRQHKQDQEDIQWYFNSLPHAKVDPAPSFRKMCQRYFNSLPHAKVDGKCTKSC